MQDTGDHYEYITVYSNDIFVFGKYNTGIFRVFNTLFPMNVFVKTELYHGGVVVTEEMNGEVTHAFLYFTYIKM